MFLKALECKIKAPHLTVYHRSIFFDFSNHLTTTPPHPTSQFSGLTREPPHPTSKKSRWFENHPTPPHLKSRWFTNHPTPPQENRGDFKTTPPHLKKIEAALKPPHLEGGVVEVIYNPARIAFITLSIITEDHFANCFLHDQSVKFRLRLHRAPARHRNIPTEEASPNTFAAWILQICCEFLVSHLMKDFPLGVHQMALGIIHRLLIYQKRSKCRLNFDWSLVLQSLVLLLKFVCSNQNSLRNRHANSDIQQLVKTALVVVNIFICCGDQIFMGTADYDKLYYELIRVTSVFDKVEQYAISQREKPSESCRGFELDNLVFNVRQIQSYFNKLLTNSQTPQQILSLIQENYSYINLRFLDGLENFVKLNQEHVIDDIVPDLIANSRKMLPFDMVVYKKLCS